MFEININLFLLFVCNFSNIFTFLKKMFTTTMNNYFSVSFCLFLFFSFFLLIFFSDKQQAQAAEEIKSESSSGHGSEWLNPKASIQKIAKLVKKISKGG